MRVAMPLVRPFRTSFGVQEARDVLRRARAPAPPPLQADSFDASLDALATLVPPAVVEALRAKRRDPTNPIGKLARDGLVE